MGKSDPIIIPKYLSLLPEKEYENACFLGFPGENNLTANIKAKRKSFYDLSLSNWNINDHNWNIKEEFDLVVSTRCPYFAKDPLRFFENCHSILVPEGTLLVDWGLGDHWRFKNYKIGWVKDGEHEHAYEDDNFLWSTVWNDAFLNHPEFIEFKKHVKKFGYDKVKDAIFDEVPEVLELRLATNKFKLSCDLKFIWEELPQLYIIVVGKKI